MNSLSTSKAQDIPKAKDLLEGLTPQQQEAVLSTQRALLILAGAGTGKTRVIVHRIAHLMRTQPEIQPSNILALAFSRKAAEEMRQRVESLLGSYADELGVFTFHSFCHQFLLDHALELNLPARLTLLDSVESWIFFREIFPLFKLRYHWNVGDPTACIEGFLRFISRAKDELVSPLDYARFVETLSDPQERSRQEEVARVYGLYQQKMREAGNLDFGDLIVETYRVLQDRPTLLKSLKSQYRYILVDEFQDTNVAQIHLLTLLAQDSGNLCVVGDDDQAIYRFRGASYASFLLMKQAFPKLQTIRLTRNYRSTQHILSAAKRLIRHNEPDRYDPQKLIWTENPPGVAVSVLTCPSDRAEAAAVVETLRRITQDPPQTELSSVAILYRAHAHRNSVVGALSRAQIPFFVQKGIGLFDVPAIKELLAFLKILQDPSDSVALFRVLSHPLWGVPLSDLASASRRAREKELSLADVLHDEDLPISDSARGIFTQFGKEFDLLRRRALREGVSQLVPAIAQESSWRLLFRFSLGHEESRSLIALGRFLRYVDRYAQTHPQAEDLGSFLWYVDSTQLAGGNPSDDEEEALGNRVRLMTIHQAKGLEFDWVILLGMVQGRFPARGRPEAIPFSEALMKEPLPQGDFHLQEERRLCYVACTRAKKGLVLMTQERAYHRPSIFVRQMTEGASETEVGRSIVAAPPDEGEGAVPCAGADEPSFPDPERFSFTQLETYRYCPMKYKYSYLYQIPVRPTPQMHFGVDLHRAMEFFFQSVMKAEIPSEEILVESFNRLYSPGRYGEPVQDEEYRRMGVRLLQDFYRRHKGSFVAPLFLEKPFLLHLKKDLPSPSTAQIRGVIDRVDELPGGGVEIIDYKSGKSKQAADLNEQLQLRIYALACQEVLGLAPKRLSFYYLRTHEKLSFDQKEEDFEETQKKIWALVDQIRSKDFTPDPSLVKCRRCDFRNLCPASAC